MPEELTESSKSQPLSTEDESWLQTARGQLEREVRRMPPTVLTIAAWADQLVKLGAEWKQIIRWTLASQIRDGTAETTPEAEELIAQVEQKLAEERR